MHDRRQLLLLPNCWDAGSARLFVQRGFAAVATTSAGVAWSLGYADGECAPLADVLAALARIARVVGVPITADIETGYGDTPADVAATVTAVIAAGAVGVNIEDGMRGHGPLRDAADATSRIRAARLAADASGVPIVINARVDHWMQHDAVAPSARLADAIDRAKSYLAAGADCIYPIGLADPATLRVLVEAINAPINVAAGSTMPDLHALETIGVARVSTATRFATVALGAVDHALGVMRASGSFAALASDFSYADAQQLFASR
ncbi:MAG: isocitrate lyase/phosphoenolpyruvate mutase family protein [Rhodanobacter sp.]